MSSTQQSKTQFDVEIENKFYFLFDDTTTIEIRKSQSRKIIEGIIEYLYDLYNGAAEIVEYNKIHPTKKLNEKDIAGRVNILVELGKFPDKFSSGAIFTL